MKIPTDKIRELIGPGGKMIRSIVEQTGCKIDVERRWQREDFLVGRHTAADRCIQMITDICAVAEVGKTYLGKVVRIVDFGAFVEIFPGTDGGAAAYFPRSRRTVSRKCAMSLNEGDQILVKVLALGGQQDQVEPQGDLEGAAGEVEVGSEGVGANRFSRLGRDWCRPDPALFC